MTSRRINSGIYEIEHNDRKFEIERFPDGTWMLFEIINGSREWWNDYPTKRDAMAAIKES